MKKFTQTHLDASEIPDGDLTITDGKLYYGYQGRLVPVGVGDEGGSQGQVDDEFIKQLVTEEIAKVKPAKPTTTSGEIFLPYNFRGNWTKVGDWVTIEINTTSRIGSQYKEAPMGENVPSEILPKFDVDFCCTSISETQDWGQVIFHLGADSSIKISNSDMNRITVYGSVTYYIGD